MCHRKTDEIQRRFKNHKAHRLGTRDRATLCVIRQPASTSERRVRMSRSHPCAVLGFLVLALALAACGRDEPASRSAPAATPMPPIDASERAATIRVEASGFVPRERLVVNQCRSSPDRCSCGAGGENKEVHADAAGNWSGEFSPRQWIFTTDGWVDCITETCVVKVAAGSDRVISTTPVDLSGATPVARPTPVMSVQPPGPYVTGQVLTISITGAPPDLQGSLTICTKVPPDAATSGACVVPRAGFFTTDSEGSATLVDYLLPEWPCEAPGSCELSWRAGYGFPPHDTQDIDYP
jgi:hypothetical protein